ncbi:MAG: PAS domain S-box protein [Chthoniobacteraceae bacterium]
MLRIIHLEDNLYDQELVAGMLSSAEIDCEITHVDDHKTFQAALNDVQADLIISDFTMPGYTGVRALELAQQVCKSIPFIFFSGTIGEDAAIESLKRGATDYVLKQFPDRLVAAVRRALVEAGDRAARHHAEEELKRRDVLLRQIMENVEDLIAVVDFNGRRMISSPSYQKLFGLNSSMVGSDFLSEVHPEDKRRVQNNFAQTIAAGVGRRVEYRIVLSDGGLLYMEAQGSVIHQNVSGSYVLWVAHDITAHKFSEAKILEQAALLDEAHDAICVNDLDQCILFWNKGAERLYGWTASDAMGRNANELLFQNDSALMAVKTLIKRGVWHGELRQVTKSGRQIIVESRWTLINETNGKSKSILVINTDITKRKEAEEKIKEQAALLDKAQDAIFLCNRREEIVYWNQGATRLYGWTPQQAAGKSIQELLFKDMPPDWAEIRNAVATKGEWFGELHQVSREEKALVVQSRQTLIFDSNNEPSSVLYINSDITEKKQIEAQFLRTQRMENLGALAGGIAHDLNNVLAPIMLAVEIIQDDPLGDSNGKLLETIAASTRRGSDLVKQILSFARGATGQKVPIQIRHVVSEVVKLIGNTFPRNIVLKSNVPHDLPNIMGDSTQLHQVLLNLCVNARDAMHNKGTLTIEVSTVNLDGKKLPSHPGPVTGPFLVLSVGDTGTGIPPEVLTKIFEPFFTTKDPGKGTGLGLSTVMSIVKNHGGYIEVSSQPGLGTKFHVYFPIPGERAVLQKTPGDSRPKHGNGEKILVVDDEIAISEIISTTLIAYNYRVLTADSSAEAVELFSNESAGIDLVITDMMMPDLDGSALVEALQRIKPGVKIVAMSGYTNQNKIASPGDGKVQAFLPKPFSTTQLLSTLRSILDSRESSPPATVSSHL